MLLSLILLSTLHTVCSESVGGLHKWLELEKEYAGHIATALAPCQTMRNNIPLRSGLPSPSVVEAQRKLAQVFSSLPDASLTQARNRTSLPHFLLPSWPSRFKALEAGCYSQNEEDGILLWIFALIRTSNKVAVEICSGVGYENNVANLAVLHGWRTMQVDGNPQNAEIANVFYSQAGMPPGFIKPVFKQAFITAENVNGLISHAGFSGPIDLLSIDMDGMDYYVLRNITVVTPRVIVVEIQDIFGWQVSKARPYSPNFVASASAYTESIGVSLGAYLKLLKAYRLVGCIKEGYNAFFVHKSIRHPLLPEVHPSSCFAMLQDDLQLRLKYAERLRTALQFNWVDPGAS